MQFLFKQTFHKDGNLFHESPRVLIVEPEKILSRIYERLFAANDFTPHVYPDLHRISDLYEDVLPMAVLASVWNEEHVRHVERFLKMYPLSTLVVLHGQNQMIESLMKSGVRYNLHRERIHPKDVVIFTKDIIKNL